MKWINCAAAATNYPTNGLGGVTATSSASGFADGLPWDNLPCLVYSVVLIPGASAGTVTITSHDGTTQAFPALHNAINTADGCTQIDLGGVEMAGLRVVTATAGTAIVFFETGVPASYSAT